MHACTHSSEINNLRWYLSLVNISTQKKSGISTNSFNKYEWSKNHAICVDEGILAYILWSCIVQRKKELHGLSFKVTSSNLKTRFSALFAEVRMNKKSTCHFFPYQDLQNFSKLINRFQEKLVTDGRASINSKNLFWKGAQKEFLHVIFKEFLKF